MPLGNTTWSEGRYHTRHHFLYDTAVDLTGATGDKATFRVLHDKIQILEFGILANAAFPNEATMTTLPVLALDKVVADTAVRSEITLAAATADHPITRVSPDYEQLENVAAYTDLDSYQTANPIIGPPTYPTAVKGDLLVVELMTSGVGGTQSARFYVKYREIEA